MPQWFGSHPPTATCQLPQLTLPAQQHVQLTPTKHCVSCRKSSSERAEHAGMEIRCPDGGAHCLVYNILHKAACKGLAGMLTPQQKEVRGRMALQHLRYV